jgi:catechol 2,3-dioxygenase-like lactoylglutathione lyase family enzyme
VILGAHVIVYSRDAEADRAFFRDVLGFPSVDAGGGWLIFGAGPSEVAFHPGEDNDQHELYLMCDDLPALLAELEAKGVARSPVHRQPWGDLATVGLPGGGELGVYQPRHPLALGLAPSARRGAKRRPAAEKDGGTEKAGGRAARATKARTRAAPPRRGSRPPAKRR